MFLKSIRWRLQLWYGVILVAVLAGFGLTAYQFERVRQLRGIDEELNRRCGALLSSLGPQAGPAQRGGPERQPDDPAFRETGFDAGPPPEGPPVGDVPQRRGGLRMSAQQAALFGGDSNGFYYVVWRRDGKELARSSNAPAELKIMPLKSTGVDGELPRQREVLREAYHFTPPGECVLTGRAIGRDLKDLRRFAWMLAAVGGVVLLCGFAGGWVLASRAIRPIEDISGTAVKIAAGDLSQRIDVADTDNELGRLAGVLNSTFARLEASFAQQGQFTADAAHELRTPVSVLLMQTQTALKQERNSAEYRATIEACHRAAQRMRGLLESLLELARLDSGQEPMKKMRFDLGRLAEECAELISPLAAERNIKITIEAPPLEWTGDRERLGQVITNLLANATHYNHDGGEVRVSVGRENHEALVTVADTGLGISEEDLPRIFERFYRADQSRSNAKGRTGLGLAISKAIVEAHGGSFEVRSQLGQGSTFVLRLPARD